MSLEEQVAAKIQAAESVQDKGFFDPTSLKRLVRYVTLVHGLLDRHYSEKVATVWKARFNKSANNMLIAYDRCGLGKDTVRRRRSDEADDEYELGY